MSRGTLNKIQIIGHLGRDPEMRYTPDGKAVTNFSVATGGRWQDRDGNERDDTEWFRVEAWDRLGETCNQYLTKGTKVYIEGRIKTRKYNDKDGIERTSVDVVASNMLILSSRNAPGGGYEGDAEEEHAPAQAARPAARPAPEPRAPVSSRPPAQPARPANGGRPVGRNQPQAFDNEEDLPF